MAVKRTKNYEQALACDLFDKFCNATKLKDIFQHYHNLCKACSITPTNFPEFFPKIKEKIPSWKANEVWAKFEKRASHASYARGEFCKDTRVLIIGAGPCGLRTAIEAQLCGARTVILEKRKDFTRNNVLHLWPFSITDLRNLGAKIFHGKFCAGSIDHISIRQLQCILLKIALLVGVEVHMNVGFEGLIEPQSEDDFGWKASLSPADHPVCHFHFDVVIGADGRRSTLPGFKRKTLRAKLAIAITANFIHNHTEAEAKVQEISGVSYIYRQSWFQEMEEAMGISLENIVYYKDETHYFVMTPTKQSLLDKGVLYEDFPDPEQLLSPENVDPEALQLFTMQAVVFATENRLPNLQFATNSRGEPDVAVFDFTTVYASENACRAIQRKGHKLLMGLVGDALLEPFWPTGTGIARGFLAAFDAGWMIRSWGKGLKSICEVLAERESIHRLLNQTTTENLSKDFAQYSIDPATRYPKINLNAVSAHQVKNLYDSDEEIKDIFLSIREAKRCRLVPGKIILHWFQEQLSDDGITVTSIPDIFKNGNALIAILERYRPDLLDDLNDCNPCQSRNQQALAILEDEFNIPWTMGPKPSELVTDADTPILIQYLSQMYNLFKGEIPKTRDIPQEGENHISERRPSYPNNSALHHSLSIKKFLEAKEQLQKKKAAEEVEAKKDRRRSQLAESIIMQTESNYNPQRSTSTVNIPLVKLCPIPPGDLFSLCRNGSDREKSRKPKIPGDTLEFMKLARSRSDVGHSHKTKGFGFPSSPISPPTRSSSSSSKEKTKDSELEDMQQRIRKSKAAPLGDIVSTFLGKHINQNSGCLSNEQSDENPLSSERRLVTRPPRPRSTYQNLNDHQHQRPPSSYYYAEDQENVEKEERSNNPLFNNHEPDPGFKDKCKFLEKNLYNSGRDIKVHLGAAWFQKAEEASKKKSPVPVPRAQVHPSQKSQSSASTTGFHPLKRGSSFNVRNQMEDSFNKTEKGGNKGETRLNPNKVLFLERKLGEIANRYVPGETQTPPKNDHSSLHLHHNKQRQADPKSLRSNKGKSQKIGASANDSDLDCFLNDIDFGRIDGQELQELLSSF